MILEGLKLMALGMTTVILFLMFMILSIELLKYLNRNFTLLEKNSLEEKPKSEYQTTFSDPKNSLPIEVLVAAISEFESENKNY